MSNYVNGFVGHTSTSPHSDSKLSKYFNSFYLCLKNWFMFGSLIISVLTRWWSAREGPEWSRPSPILSFPYNDRPDYKRLSGRQSGLGAGYCHPRVIIFAGLSLPGRQLQSAWWWVIRSLALSPHTEKYYLLCLWSPVTGLVSLHVSIFPSVRETNSLLWWIMSSSQYQEYTVSSDTLHGSRPSGDGILLLRPLSSPLRETRGFTAICYLNLVRRNSEPGYLADLTLLLT